MKLINAMSELGCFTLIGNKLYIASSAGFRQYLVSRAGINAIRSGLLEAEYDDTNVVNGFTTMFSVEDLPEELDIVNPIVLQEVFIAIVCDMLAHEYEEIHSTSGVWYRDIK
jgi:hypothetical protein